MRRHRFAVHRTEPAQADQLRNAARVLAVSLHRHELESSAHVSGLQQFDRQTRLLAMRNGDVDGTFDLAISEIDQWKALPGVDVVTAPSLGRPVTVMASCAAA